MTFFRKKATPGYVGGGFASGLTSGRRMRLAGCVIALAGATGCSDLSGLSSARGGTEGATPLRMPNVSSEAAFDAGITAMRQYFHHVEAARPQRRLESAMVEYDQKGGTGRFRDTTLNFRNRMRRKATLWITDSGTGCVARCQVRRQRLDTADHRLFQQQQQFNDLPNSTPIDRDAGTTTSQNQAWTETSRDRQMERELLQVLFSLATKKDKKS